jgi:hypothetical protein
MDVNNIMILYQHPNKKEDKINSMMRNLIFYFPLLMHSPYLIEKFGITVF